MNIINEFSEHKTKMGTSIFRIDIIFEMEEKKILIGEKRKTPMEIALEANEIVWKMLFPTTDLIKSFISEDNLVNDNFELTPILHYTYSICKNKFIYSFFCGHFILTEERVKLIKKITTKYN